MENDAQSLPPIPERNRVPFAEIQDITGQIVLRFNPSRIILFGSYAYGQPQPESDVDLLVIMETLLNETQQAVEILKAISYRFGLDLLVYTPQHLQQRLEWGDPFLREIIARGKVLFAAAGT